MSRNPAPIQAIVNKSYDDLYELRYIKSNTMQSKLIRFDGAEDTGEMVTLAKRYCNQNNLRFVWVEPAVVTLHHDEEISE